MRTATVGEVDDATVGSHSVTAHSEHHAERTGKRSHEAAVATRPFGSARHRRSGTVIAVDSPHTAYALLARELLARHGLQLDRDYFDHIIDALRGANEWLLVGPGAAKDQLLNHVGTHVAWLKEKLVGVEAMDHPTDGELLAHARRFFKAADRMRANSPSLAS